MTFPFPLGLIRHLDNKSTRNSGRECIFGIQRGLKLPLRRAAHSGGPVTDFHRTSLGLTAAELAISGEAVKVMSGGK